MLQVQFTLIEKYKEANLALARLLMVRFGGLTTHKGDGLWFSEEQGKVISDKVIIATVYVPETLSKPALLEAARALALGYLEAVKLEECMLVAVAGEGFLVNRKDIHRS